MVKFGIARAIKWLGGKPRGVSRIWGRESDRSGSEPAKMGVTRGGTTMDAR